MTSVLLLCREGRRTAKERKKLQREIARTQRIAGRSSKTASLGPVALECLRGERPMSKLSRVASCILLAALSGTALAQFPTKPVRLVVSTTAGSQPDSLARLFGQKLSESWGQPVVVDNRPGAQGTLAATPVSKAAP